MIPINEKLLYSIKQKICGSYALFPLTIVIAVSAHIILFQYRKSSWGNLSQPLVIELGSVLILIAIVTPLLLSLIRLHKKDKKNSDTARIMREIMDNTIQLTGLIDNRGIVVEANNEALKAIGTTRNDVVGKSFMHLPWWNESTNFHDRLKIAFERAMKGSPVSYEALLTNSSGCRMVLDFHLQPILDTEGNIQYILAEAMDITQKKKTESALKDSEERFRLTADASKDALWEVDIPSRTYFFSDRWFEICKYEPREFDNSKECWEKIIHPDDFEPAFTSFISNVMDTESSWIRNQVRITDKYGILKWILVQGKIIRNDRGEAIRLAGSITDITDEKVFEKKIYELAYYDTPTMLPNRAHIYDRLSKILASDEKGTLFLVNINS
ncbi:MAG TPA: PAS domain S-box protein, partial [Spirochaetota bacterium]